MGRQGTGALPQQASRQDSSVQGTQMGARSLLQRVLGVIFSLKIFQDRAPNWHSKKSVYTLAGCRQPEPEENPLFFASQPTTSVHRDGDADPARGRPTRPWDAWPPRARRHP